MNKLRSELTELTPWEIIKNEIPSQPIEYLIKFPEQPSTRDRQEIIQLVTNRIRNKAMKYEGKNKSGSTKYIIGRQVLTKTHMICQTHQIRK